MNIYDKITGCEKIVCFIEGANINSISIFYKKELLKSQFYYVVLSYIDNIANNVPVKDITISGYETENSIVLKPLFSGNHIKLQKAIRGVI